MATSIIETKYVQKGPLNSKRKREGNFNIWGGFFSNEFTYLVNSNFNRKKESKKYCDTLQSYLFSFFEENSGIEWMFQQKSALIHISWVTKDWFATNLNDVIDWPSILSDSNFIENDGFTCAQGLLQ